MILSSLDSVQSKVLMVLSQLPLSEQEKALEFVLSLHRKQKFQDWDQVSEEEAAALKAEFAEEDLASSETVLTNYLYQLQQEDLA